MKTHQFKIKSLIYFGLTLAALVACNKKDDSSGNIASTPYQMINGNCYNSSNQVVPTTYCTNNTMCNNGLNNGGYYMNGSYCYSPQGQVVSNAYCTNTNTNTNTYTMCNNGLNNGGYYMNGSYCYSPQGQVVSNAYCTSGNGMMGQQCNGSYLYQSGYWSQMVWCAGSNCRGYTLYDINSHQSVTCQ